MKLRFILSAIIMMASALTVLGQIPVTGQAQPSPTPKNLLRGNQIVKTGTDDSGNNVWGFKNPPLVRKAVPPAAKPFINSFDAESNNVRVGEATTLHFSVSGARNVTINSLDVTGDTQLVVTPTTTTAYRLVATNSSGRVTEDLVVHVRPTPGPSNTDWGKLLNDWGWLIVLVAVFILTAYLVSEYLAYQRWREEQAVWFENCRLRQNEAPAMPQTQQQPAPFTFNQTINIDGGGQPVITTETAAPQPVTAAPEATAAVADPMSGKQPTVAVAAAPEAQTSDN